MNKSADTLPSRAVSRVAQYHKWIEPLLLTLLLSLWFGYELGDRALWSPDEGRYAEIPREMIETGDYLTPRLNGVKYFEKPPLVYWLEAGAIKVFGLSEWALRLWPALFALLGCLAIYYLGRRLHNQRTGLFAALVLASSPLYDFMGGALTLDMPLSALMTISLGAFLLGVREPPGTVRRRWLYLFYATTALAVLTKGLVGLVLPALVIGSWIALLGEWQLLRSLYIPSGTAIVLVIAAPWHVLVSQANPEFAQFYFVHEHFSRYLTSVHHRYKPSWFFIPIIFAGMYPWSALLPFALRESGLRFWRERRRHRETWFLLLWALLPFLFFSFSSSKLVPYILPVLPPLALLLAKWLANDWQTRTAHWREGVLLLVLGVVFATVMVAAPHWFAKYGSVTNIAAQFGWRLYLMAGSFLLVGILPLVFQFSRNRNASLIALFIGAVVLVAVFDTNFSHLDVGRSVKPLALALKQELAPTDEVMTFEEYYQDLPVYLERRITVVNSAGEMHFGTTVEDTSAWMIDTTVFYKRWVEPRRIFMFTSPNNYTQLLAKPPGPSCLLQSTERVVMVVNRACRT